MKSERQLRKSAGLLFLFTLILALAGYIVFYVGLWNLFKDASLEPEDIINQALVYCIVYAVLCIITNVLSFINWIQFLRLWRWYGPRFWRCLLVILGVISFLLWVTILVLYFGFSINFLV